MATCINNFETHAGILFRVTRSALRTPLNTIKMNQLQYWVDKTQNDSDGTITKEIWLAARDALVALNKIEQVTEVVAESWKVPGEYNQPCKYCLAVEGTTRDNGFHRCNKCGEPGQ